MKPFIPLLAMAGLFVPLAGCSREPLPATVNPPAVKVQTVEAQLTTTPDINEVVGTVRAKLSATVAAQVMAAIQAISAQPGERVSRGQTLVKLDDRDARAEFEKAKADFDRYQKLLANQATTRAEFDAVQTRFRVAQTALSDTQLTAPFEGVIAGKYAEVGDLAMPGKPLLIIEQPTDFRLEVNVPERLAGTLGLGQSLDTVIDSTGEKCGGKIAEIIPAADPVSRSILVKIDLPCRQTLKSGMFGHAQFPGGERSAILVPKAAVHERGQLTYVFVVADGHARMRLVRPGKSSLGTVEILSGLQGGEPVIVSAAAEISDGQPVSP